MARYKVVGNWTALETHQIDGYFDEGRIGKVVWMVGDLLDTLINHTYRDGAYRVAIQSRYPIGLRTKTFTGEMAWNDSKLHAEDAVLAIQHAERKAYTERPARA